MHYDDVRGRRFTTAIQHSTPAAVKINEGLDGGAKNHQSLKFNPLISISNR